METNDFKYPSIRQVQEAYRNANEEQRSLLVELFGQAAKKERPVTERIKTFEDACRELGENHPFVVQYNEIFNNYLDGAAESNTCDIVAYLKLRIITAALNEGWTPQFTKHEYRYYPWFWLYNETDISRMDEDMRNNVALLECGNADDGAYCGIGCYRSYCTPSCTHTYLGSRLCFKNPELAKYAGRQFIGLCTDFYLTRK